MDSNTTADTKTPKELTFPIQNADAKKVERPKRRYIKKKDRLQGIIVKHENVVIRFD